MKAFFSILILGTGTVLAVDAPADSVSAAIEKAIPYLEKEGAWWIEKKECVSCHHTSFLVWAGDLALDAGFAVNATVLDQQREWMRNSFLEKIKPNPKTPEVLPKPGEVKGDRNVEGVCQFLISPSAKKAPQPVLETLREIVHRNQSEDGNWKPGGQLPRQDRPELETQWASNQWAELALKTSGRKPRLPTETWKAGVPAETSEWHMLNLMLRPENPHALKNLLEKQNDDGGWSWISGESSDPSGTGQALIALGRSGKAAAHPEAIRKARDFLVKTQSDEGHWETRGTKDRDETTRVSNFWGTAWAVIGLLESRSEGE
ncbi:MAG: hypothetical protein P1V20_01625 [Verrucomicrobiales bacterium]|nr:hypothetical protein [Verrucomicrobiales bacterium]